MAKARRLERAREHPQPIVAGHDDAFLPAEVVKAARQAVDEAYRLVADPGDPEPFPPEFVRERPGFIRWLNEGMPLAADGTPDGPLSIAEFNVLYPAYLERQRRLSEHAALDSNGEAHQAHPEKIFPRGRKDIQQDDIDIALAIHDGYTEAGRTHWARQHFQDDSDCENRVTRALQRIRAHELRGRISLPDKPHGKRTKRTDQ